MSRYVDSHYVVAFPGWRVQVFALPGPALHRTRGRLCFAPARTGLLQEEVRVRWTTRAVNAVVGGAQDSEPGIYAS